MEFLLLKMYFLYWKIDFALLCWFPKVYMQYQFLYSIYILPPHLSIGGMIRKSWDNAEDPSKKEIIQPSTIILDNIWTVLKSI